jgi:protein TonB
MKLAKHVLSVALTVFVFATATVSLQAQSASTQVYDYKLVDKLPTFPGGQLALTEFITTNLVYPEACRFNKTQAMVTVGFTISPEGNVSAVTILSDPEVDNRLLREAIKVVALMPAWIPAEVNGQKVTCKMQVPVSFKLEN